MNNILAIDESQKKYLPSDQNRSVPSLIKWTGSKRSQAKAIFALAPPHSRYIEPFVGGGALLFLAAKRGSIASDIYEPLIDLWKMVQKDPYALIENYKSQWKALNQELDNLDIRKLNTEVAIPNYFYKVRARFNETQCPMDLNFILRTCVNGIVRFNDKGAFNNSFHLSRRGMDPNRFSKIVETWTSRIQGVVFACRDYSITLEEAREGDFVYFDPPYAGNKQRYALDLNLERFFSQLQNLNRRGVKWALSFDGQRGEKNLLHEVPNDLFKRHLMISNGFSAVKRVLHGPLEEVRESLYLNF